MNSSRQEHVPFVMLVLALTCVRMTMSQIAGHEVGLQNPNNPSSFTGYAGDVVTVQNAVHGGNLAVDETGNGFILTLRGIDEGVSIFRESKTNSTASVRPYPKDHRWSQQHSNTDKNSFALLFVKIPTADDTETFDPKNSSVISLNLLDRVDDEGVDDSTVKYKVQLGDLAMHTNAEGEILETKDMIADIVANNFSFEVPSLLMIDLTDTDEEARDEATETMSIEYQTKIGEIGRAYKGAVRKAQGDIVSAHGFILGPLTFICCPAFMGIVWFPWHQIAIWTTGICCWM